MHERELRAHVAALLIAARHVVEAHGKASVREQEEAIARLRRIVKNVERQVASSSQTGRAPTEAPASYPEREPGKKDPPYEAGQQRIEQARGRAAKQRSRHR